MLDSPKDPNFKLKSPTSHEYMNPDPEEDADLLKTGYWDDKKPEHSSGKNPNESGSAMKGQESNATIELDAEGDAADWIKKTWDLPPYMSKEFCELFPDVEQFKLSAAYKFACDSGLILDDEWLGDFCEATPPNESRMSSPGRPMELINNEQLTLENVPQPDASWFDILEFSLTFDGYEFWGTFERCAEVAAARAHGTLTGLRTCLFFEQRLWRSGDESPPSKRTLLYWQSIIRKIRAMVAKESLVRATASR